MMDENHTHLDLAYFREKLLSLRKEILQIEQTGNEAAEVVELDQTRVGRLSRMDALQAQAISKESKRRREILMQRIDAALKRVHRDEFGFCLQCGESIHLKRLEFDPTTLLCIDCANSQNK